MASSISRRVLVGQLDIGRCEVLLEPVTLGGARDRDDLRMLACLACSIVCSACSRAALGGWAQAEAKAPVRTKSTTPLIRPDRGFELFISLDSMDTEHAYDCAGNLTGQIPTQMEERDAMVEVDLLFLF